MVRCVSFCYFAPDVSMFRPAGAGTLRNYPNFRPKTDGCFSLSRCETALCNNTVFLPVSLYRMLMEGVGEGGGGCRHPLWYVQRSPRGPEQDRLSCGPLRRHDTHGFFHPSWYWPSLIDNGGGGSGSWQDVFHAAADAGPPREGRAMQHAGACWIQMTADKLRFIRLIRQLPLKAT